MSEEEDSFNKNKEEYFNSIDLSSDKGQNRIWNDLCSNCLFPLNLIKLENNELIKKECKNCNKIYCFNINILKFEEEEMIIN
jgi:hypothetical protein